MANDIEQLRDALREGDNEAFRQVVRDLAEPLYRYVQPQLRDSAASQDVVQQAFIRLWKHRKRLKPEGSLQTYVFFIATNLVRDAQRRKALRSKRENEAAEMRETEAPGLKALAREAFETARQLPTELREVVLLRFGQGFTAAEAAEALGIPEGTVKTRQRTALEKLREKLLGAGVLPAGLSLPELEQTLRESTKTSVKVPTSLVMSVEALVMANVGTNTGVTIAILAGALALLLLAGGVAIGAGWLLTPQGGEEIGPISALPNDDVPLVRGDTGNAGHTDKPLDNGASGTDSGSKQPDGQTDNAGVDAGESRPGFIEFTIRGRVVDGDGDGIGGAWVGVRDPDRGDRLAETYRAIGFGSVSGPGESPGVGTPGSTDTVRDFMFEGDAPSAITDVRGYYELPCRGKLEDSTAPLALAAWAVGYSAGSRFMYVTQESTGTIEQNLLLSRHDRVLTFRTEPAVATRLQVQIRQFMTNGSSVSTTWTDAGPDGRHQVSLDSDSADELAFHAPGFAPAKVEVRDVGQDQVDAGTIKLERGRRLAGVVTGVEGEPIAGAVIKLQDEFEIFALSAADGSFEIQGVADGTQQLSARHAQYAEARIDVATGSQDVDHVQIVMDPGVSVEGIVRFQGAEVAPEMRNVRVLLLRAEDAEASYDHWLSEMNGVTPDETHAFKFARVAPGDYVLRARYDGKDSPPVEVHVEDLPLEVNVVFGSGASVSGHVKGRDGLPLIDARVSMSEMSAQNSSGHYSCRTDAEGAYLFEDVQPGTYVVLLDKFDTDYGEALFNRRTVNVVDAPVMLDIDLSAQVPGNRVAGRVVLDGQPLFNEYMLVGTGLNTGVWRGRGDEQGKFEIQGVPPGDYYLYATSNRRRTTIFRKEIEFTGWDETCEVADTVASGQLTITLSGEGLQANRGKLAIRPVYDAPYGRDVLLDMFDISVTPGEGNEMTVKDLVAGQYCVVAQIPGFAIHSAVVDVNSAASVELKLSPTVGSAKVMVKEVVGGAPSIKDERARAWCLMGCVALDLPGQPGMYFRLGALGVDEPVMFSDLAPGRYELRVSGPVIEPYTEVFEVKAGEECVVRPTLQRAAEIELSVDVAAEVLGSANVIITDAASGRRVRVVGLLNPMLIGMPDAKQGGLILVAPLPAGTYRLQLQLRGYATIELEVAVQAGQKATRTLTTQPK